MSAPDTARLNYQIANEHLMQRLQMRENVLVGYLAGIGTILTIGFGQTTNISLALSIPFLALGCSVMVSHHNLMIGALLEYCTQESKAFLTTHTEYAPQFDTSLSFQKYGKQAIRLSFFGQIVILVLPCAVSLAANWQHVVNFSLLLTGFWWFSFVCTVVTVLVLVRTHRFRTKQMPLLR